MEIKKFRRRPLIFEAVQFTRENRDEIAKWTGGALLKIFIENREVIVLSLSTPDGMMSAQIGDWIVKSDNGGFYPRSPETFKNNFDAVL